MTFRPFRLAIALGLLAASPSDSSAQVRRLKVISSDSQPVVYAYVTIEGGIGQIADEQGEISLGAGKAKTITVHVRRIGYEPWFGKLNLPDTAALLTVTLPPLPQRLAEVRVAGATHTSLQLRGFYDRWLMRQKGLLSATFIGPEEIELRHPDKITNMLSGLNGVMFRRTTQNDLVAFGYNNTCQMAIVVDGFRQCPALGCKCDICGAQIPEIGSRGVSPRDTAKLTEFNSVPIDRYLDANSVAAIEVYSRGGNMPTSLQTSDDGCGVIAFWTGSRKP